MWICECSIKKIKGKIYRTLKIDFGFEKLPKLFRSIVLKFCTANNRLPEETDR